LRLHALLILAVGFLVAADAPKEDAAKKELKKSEGTWQVVSFESDGNKLGDDEAKQVVMVVKDGKYTVKMMDNVVSKGTMKIDPAKNPKTIDVMPDEGENAGQTMLGIYELKDDEQKICIATPDKKRPTKFDGDAGTGQILIVFKRVKQ